MEQISKRRSFSEERIQKLRGKLSEAELLLSARACVYATGSYGRREASVHSDLDLFIVGKPAVGKDGEQGSLLSRLSEICVKADLIRTTQEAGIRDFDGDGRYLTHQPLNLLTGVLGKPEDDASNAFTARLLLLLESHPLLEREVYDEIIGNVISAYWGDYEDHSEEFVPAFLANDILRFWRTFCVNYEAMTQRNPDEKKVKRKVKRYKLKFSRLMTCFSGLLYLLWVFGRQGTVRPSSIIEMISLSPTSRLETLIKQESVDNSIIVCLEAVLRKYDSFLQVTDVPEVTLLSQFADKSISARHFNEASEFGSEMFDAINLLGRNNKLHKLLLV